MTYTFSLINPPTGFSITNAGDINVSAAAPAFSGMLNVSCTNGINTTTAQIQFNWANPTKSAMFSETAELFSETLTTATIEAIEQIYITLQTIGTSFVELEALAILNLTTIVGSTVSLSLVPSGPQLTGGGLTWSASFWDAGFGAYVPTYASAKYIEVYYVLGATGSSTDVATIVCKPAIQAELLTSVRAVYSNPSILYYDCLSGLNEAGNESALYYFEKP